MTATNIQFYEIFRYDASQILGNPLWDLFRSFELTTIMRQKDDYYFAVALNHLAIGKLSNFDIQLFQNRQCNINIVPSDSIHLFGNNADVDSFNAQKINECNEIAIISIARDQIASNISNEKKQKIMASLMNEDPRKTNGIPYKIILKKNIKYIIVVNIDTNDGLVNGATGILREIDCTSGKDSQIPYRLWLEFPEEKVGPMARSKETNRKYLGKNLTPIRPYQCNFTKYQQGSGQITINRTQFPLVPAEAITIHKSQGSTYTSVAVHLRRGITRALCYVAFSRATSANGLYIIGTFTPPTAMEITNPKLFQEIQNLRTTKSMKPHFDFLKNNKNGDIQIFFHNVQSLKKHHHYISSDPYIPNFDLLLFVETWTLDKDSYLIKDFTEFIRINSNQEDQNENNQGKNKKRSPKGIICFVKTENLSKIKVLTYDQINISNNNSIHHLDYASFLYENKQIILVYRSEHFPTDQLVDILKQILISKYDTIIIGDFNIDLKTKSLPMSLNMLLQKQNFKSCLKIDESTTYVKSQIDWIFSNINNEKISAGTYQTIYSYHCALYAIAKSVKTISNNHHFDDIDDLLLTCVDGIDKRSIITKISNKVNANLKKDKSEKLKDKDHLNQSKNKLNNVSEMIIDISDDDLITSHEHCEDSRTENMNIQFSSPKNDTENDTKKIINTNFEEMNILCNASKNKNRIKNSSIRTPFDSTCNKMIIDNESDKELDRKYSNVINAFDDVFIHDINLGDSGFEEVNICGTNAYDNKKRLKSQDSFNDSGFDQNNTTSLNEQNKGNQCKKRRIDNTISDLLSNIIETQIEQNQYLNADAMEEFIKIVNSETNFNMQSTFRLRSRLESNKYKSVNKKNDVQILYSGSDSAKDIGHWICIYYNSAKNKVHVYDSLFKKNEKFWKDIHNEAIQRLYPEVNVKKDIVFEQLLTIQRKNVACGVYACANVVSLVLGYDPTKIQYKINEKQNEDEAKFLRKHLAQIFRYKTLSMFPIVN